MGYRRLNPVEKIINKLFAKKSMISEEMMEKKIISFSRPTTSYFMLLTASIIIATLGLLMNASAIVIGSMIISPLTWPMFGLADGAALGNRKRIWANLAILITSIVYGAVLAYILTALSPLKVINSEILARSQPTLLDAVVAITAGGIGALAIVRRNIADSVAGVAVALSLTPPLCVLGISLALGESSIVTGSFLLLLTNALSITLVAGVLFILVHYSWRRKLRMAPKAFVVMVVSLLVTAIPLYQLLNEYSFETSSYGVVQSRLDSFVSGTSANGSVQNIKTNLEERGGEDTLVIEADVFLPPTANITFEAKDQLVSQLEADLGRLVDLQLRVQNVSLLANADDLALRESIGQIESQFVSEVKQLNQEITVSDIQIEEVEGRWILNAQLSGYQDVTPNESSIKQIEQNLSQQFDQEVSLTVSYLPVVEIRTTNQNITENLKQTLIDRLVILEPDAELLNVRIDRSQDIPEVVLELRLPEGESIGTQSANELKDLTVSELASVVTLIIRIVNYTQISL